MGWPASSERGTLRRMAKRRREGELEPSSTSDVPEDRAPLNMPPPTQKTLARFKWFARLIPTLELLAALAVLVGVASLIYVLDKIFTSDAKTGLGGAGILYVFMIVVGTAVQVILYRGAAEALRALAEIHAKSIHEG